MRENRMMKDILIADPTLPRQMEILESLYTLHRYDQVGLEQRDTFLADVGARCMGMVCSGHFPLDRKFIDHFPAMEIVACSSVGYDAIDVDALTERNIRFTNTPDVLTNDVADTALMLMLAVRRQLLQGDHHVRSGEWGRSGMMALTTRTQGSRVGIVGLGRIGKAIAARCAVLGQEIGYHSRQVKADVDFRYFNDLVELAGWADILVAATPGGAETTGLISREVLHALGTDGTFINISRGTVVDEVVMIDALRTGQLGSAGLDVFLNEPNPDVALTSLDNVVLYPHHASGTVQTRDAMAQLVVDNLAAFFAGAELLTPVN
jgi:lactate dehydrogenase-like 2-hydroxyacid dehydrogenase